MITVLICTANRSNLLRTALKSVKAQTGLKHVEKVIVSENGGNRSSREVCHEFPELPIEYRYREQPGTALEHIQILLKEGFSTELIALLHDDDWWGDHHLLDGLAALEANPDASGYGSSHYVVRGEASMLNCCGNLFPWFAANYAEYAPWWKITRLNAVLGSCLGTLAHSSSMILRRSAYLKSGSVFDLGNPFDNDRMLLVALAQEGPLLFRPTAQVFVRNHGVQDCFNFSNEERIRHMKQTTVWMIQNTGKVRGSIYNLFLNRMALCPEDAAPTLKNLAKMPWCLPVLEGNREATRK